MLDQRSPSTLILIVFTPTQSYITPLDRTVRNVDNARSIAAETDHCMNESDCSVGEYNICRCSIIWI